MHPPPPLVIETAKLDEDTYKDPDFLGPWADSHCAPAIVEPQTCTPELTPAAEITPEAPLWLDLSKEARHYLIKVATDYHLYQQKHDAGSDMTKAETRKTVFWKAMESLAIETRIAESLAFMYQVKRRRTPAVVPNFNSGRDESTVLETTADIGLASIVREAQEYIIGTGRNYLLPAITQSVHLIQQDLLDSTYFGFPGLSNKLSPVVGSLADSQTFASFRISNDHKAKPSERLLLRHLDLPVDTIVYGLTGVIRLPGPGKYTFKYPEAYSEKLEKKQGSEILLCTAMGSTAIREKTLQNIAQPRRGDGCLDPSEISNVALVESVFHQAWGSGKAPVGPQRYQRNAKLEKVASDFKGFSGFLQFYLPAGFHVSGPSGKNVTFDKKYCAPETSVAPGEGG
ncbi:hypothetical protein MN608_03364 [Microdochium nivale]|nr:hypothetical protein MN608_03364 [Microdochium nivale]